MNTIISVDVETSGLDPAKHSILSIGAVVLSSDHEERAYYGSCKMWDGAEYAERALEVNGFTIEEITMPSKKTEAQLINDFFYWVKEQKEGGTEHAILLGHNPDFDKDFIFAASERAFVKPPFSFRTIDVHSVAYMHFLKMGKEISERLTLDNILRRMNLPAEPKPHNALTGARCNIDVVKGILS